MGTARVCLSGHNFYCTLTVWCSCYRATRARGDLTRATPSPSPHDLTCWTASVMRPPQSPSCPASQRALPFHSVNSLYCQGHSVLFDRYLRQGGSALERKDMGRWSQAPSQSPLRPRTSLTTGLLFSASLWRGTGCHLVLGICLHFRGQPGRSYWNTGLSLARCHKYSGGCSLSWRSCASSPCPVLWSCHRCFPSGGWDGHVRGNSLSSSSQRRCFLLGRSCRWRVLWEKCQAYDLRG